MSRSIPQVRTAEPSESDASSFAALIEQATHGVFHDLLGSFAPRFLATVFVEPGHDLSYERVLIVEVDGEIAGMASAYTTNEYTRDATRLKAVVGRAAGIRVLRMALVTGLSRRLFSFMDVHEEGDTYLQAIAVDRDRRGSGVGSLLLDAVVEHAVAAGSHRLALDVDVTNDGAIALYRRRGWEITGTSRPLPRWLGNTSVHRMVKSLEKS